jgi:hypothetical protein
MDWDRIGLPPLSPKELERWHGQIAAREGAARAISAMSLDIQFKPTHAGASLTRTADQECYFGFGPVRNQSVDLTATPWPNVYSIRDEFLRVKTPDQGLDFLGKTGVFLTGTETLSWERFGRWKRLAQLVQERKELADTLSSADDSGELVEALKALKGEQNAFFVGGRENGLMTSLKKLRGTYAIANKFISELERTAEEEHQRTCQWFIQPPAEACSIQWVPSKNDSRPQFAGRSSQPEKEIDLFFSRSSYRPVFVITAVNTLQAVAAAIYADRVDGIDYRKCEVCDDLFQINAHKDKKYCDRDRCKNTANQRRRRAKQSVIKAPKT